MLVGAFARKEKFFVPLRFDVPKRMSWKDGSFGHRIHFTLMTKKKHPKKKVDVFVVISMSLKGF